jgi:hypothetical protein
MKKKRLGKILRERDHISVENLEKALHDQQGKLVHLGEFLLQRGLVSKPDLVSALDEVSRIPYFDCTCVEVDAATWRLITPSMARSCCALLLETAGSKLVVVMAEPQNLRFLDELRFKSGMQISPRMAFARKSKRRSRSTTRQRNRKPPPSPPQPSPQLRPWFP